MTFDRSKWMGLAVLLLLAACAETKNLPKKDAVAASTIKGGDCSGELTLGEGSRGLIHLDALKNYSTGRLEFVGKAFVSKKALPKDMNVYTILGYTARSEKDRKTYSGVKGTAIAQALEINVGTVVPQAQAITPMGGSKTASDLRILSGLTTENVGTADSLPVLVLEQVPEHPGLYLSNYKNPPSIPLSKLEFLSARNTESLSGGVGPYRSMVLSAKGTGAAALALPGDPEPADDKLNYAVNPPKNEKYGDPIIVPIATDTTPPGEGVESRLIIQLMERSSKPKWIKTCVAEDSGKGAVEIPSKWGEGKSADKLPDGDAYAIVMRVYRMKSPLPDEVKGEIYIETAVGAMAYATVKKDPDAKE